MKEFIDNLRKQAAGIMTEETAESQNLTLTKEQFMADMLKEKDGLALLDCLENGEWRVAERLGLINGYLKDGAPYFDVPRWNNLVAHLRIVNSV
jgi:hypothetical protein